MRQVTLKGDYYEMGFQYGQLMKKQGFDLAEPSDAKIILAKASEDEVKKYFPEILDEIRGFSDATGVMYYKVRSLILTVSVAPSCTCFAATGQATKDGKTIFGRNYDMFYWLKKGAETYITYHKGANSSIGNSDIFIGREDGINDKGLAVGLASVNCEGRQPGFIFPLVVRLLLDKCADVDEAIKLATKIPHLKSMTYLLADKSGKMAALEVTTNRIHVRRPSSDYIIITNHFQEPRMQELENLNERPPDSPQRYQGVDRLLSLNLGKIDLEFAKKILRDHESLICSHIETIKLGTLWSLVASPEERTMWIADGHPCKTEYQPFSL